MSYAYLRKYSIHPLLLASVCLLCLGVSQSALAQRRVVVPRAPVKVKPAVPVIKVSPGELPEERSQLRTLADPAAKPAPELTSREKFKILHSEGVAKGTDAAKSKLTTIKLTVGQPVVENKAYLKFFMPHTVDTKFHRVIFHEINVNQVGTVTLQARLEKDARYLVDFSVYSVPIREYQMLFNGSTRITTAKGSEHLLFVVESEITGWIETKLLSDGDFIFFSAEITKVE